LFEGRKTWVFWLGLLIFGAAIIVLFWSMWYLYIYFITYTWYTVTNLGNLVPMTFGSIVFILIGLYMMKSGAIEEESAS